MDSEWAKKLADEHAWVFHHATSTVGRVAAFHLPGEYLSPHNKQPVYGPVLELENGSSFVATDPEAFLPLNEWEVAFSSMAQTNITFVVRELLRIPESGSSPNAHPPPQVSVSMPAAFVLLAAALRAQASEMDKARLRAVQGG